MKKLFYSESNFSVYPNPSSDKITVSINNSSVENEITIYNVTGQILYQKATNSQNTVLNVDYLPNGIYYIQVKNKDSVKLEKLIINK